MTTNLFQFEKEELLEARQRIAGVVRLTPLLRAYSLDNVFLKAENLQVTGSFKIRAALSEVTSLPPDVRSRGIVTSSSGNFGQAAAFAATRLGLSSKIVMMEAASPFKVGRTRHFGGEVVFCENRFEARGETVQKISREEGRVPIHPFDDPSVVAGNASLGMEILEQHPDVEHVIVPVSGGGLISGVAVGLHIQNPKVKVWGVQASGSNAAVLSFREKRRVSIPKAKTIADGLMVTQPGAITFPLIEKHVHEMVTVEESTILRALRLLFLEEKLVVEPSGAVSLAAVLEGKVPARNTVCILSGGNIDPLLLASYLNADTD